MDNDKGFNTLVYSESEIERIARTAFEVASKRQGRVCSVDKANVLEATELWREVVTSVAKIILILNYNICMLITRPCNWFAYTKTIRCDRNHQYVWRYIV